MVNYDPFQNNILIGTRAGKLYRISHTFAVKDSLQLGSAPSSVVLRSEQNPIVSCMGIMDPNDLQAGAVLELTPDQPHPKVLIDSIKRPVDIQQADLNNDGREDLIVSAFGNLTGGLTLYEKSDGTYREHVLHNLPGTRKTIVYDFNGDGLPDILALITQGDEQVALFTNRGNFKFSYRIVMKFPPVYGSSYFELADFNHDGHPDILYTNGDNADYSPVLKPYHGVRIFLNDGKNHFSESWFHPMYGASMARAMDFDEDGDLDVAVISFFPDFQKYPERSFIYFENHQGAFKPSYTPLAGSGRWITMESADVDRDGDIDLLLGALNFPAGVPDSLVSLWREHPTSLLVLKNTRR